MFLSNDTSSNYFTLLTVCPFQRWLGKLAMTKQY